MHISLVNKIEFYKLSFVGMETYAVNKLKVQLIRYIILVFLFFIGFSFMLPNIVQASEGEENLANMAIHHIQNIKNLENSVVKYSFKHYNLAENYIMRIEDENLKNQLLSQLYPYAEKVYSDEIKAVLSEFNTLFHRKDIKTYEDLEFNINAKIANSIDKEYLINELAYFGELHVYIPEVKEAIKALNKARLDETYIEEAEKAIVNSLVYKNAWTMSFLLNELNNIKYKIQNKTNILIIGDSIVLGMSSLYENGKPLTRVENAWWRELDPTYNTSLIAVGGMGVLEPGGYKLNPTYAALGMLKFAEEVNRINTAYDKIVIALSTNDFYYSPEEYKKALNELVEHIESKYNFKEIIFMNFFYHEKDMEEVAKVHGGKFIDIDMNSINKFNSDTDPWHPSIEGQKQIADIIIPYLKDLGNT